MSISHDMSLTHLIEVLPKRCENYKQINCLPQQIFNKRFSCSCKREKRKLWSLKQTVSKLQCLKKV